MQTFVKHFQGLCTPAPASMCPGAAGCWPSGGFLLDGSSGCRVSNGMLPRSETLLAKVTQVS